MSFISRTIRKLDDTTQRLRALRMKQMRAREAGEAGQAAPKPPPPAAPKSGPPAASKPVPPARPTAAAPGEGGSGRVRHDERGNAVWDIAVATGVFALESTSKLLKRLEAPELKIEDDHELKIEDDKSGGYDPYNRRR